MIYTVSYPLAQTNDWVAYRATDHLKNPVLVLKWKYDFKEYVQNELQYWDNFKSEYLPKISATIDSLDTFDIILQNCSQWRIQHDIYEIENALYIILQLHSAYTLFLTPKDCMIDNIIKNNEKIVVLDWGLKIENYLSLIQETQSMQIKLKNYNIFWSPKILYQSSFNIKNYQWNLGIILIYLINGSSQVQYIEQKLVKYIRQFNQIPDASILLDDIKFNNAKIKEFLLQLLDCHYPIQWNFLPRHSIFSEYQKCIKFFKKRQYKSESLPSEYKPISLMVTPKKTTNFLNERTLTQPSILRLSSLFPVTQLEKQATMNCESDKQTFKSNSAHEQEYNFKSFPKRQSNNLVVVNSSIYNEHKKKIINAVQQNHRISGSQIENLLKIDKEIKASLQKQEQSQLSRKQMLEQKTGMNSNQIQQINFENIISNQIKCSFLKQQLDRRFLFNQLLKRQKDQYEQEQNTSLQQSMPVVSEPKKNIDQTNKQNKQIVTSSIIDDKIKGQQKKESLNKNSELIKIKNAETIYKNNDEPNDLGNLQKKKRNQLEIIQDEIEIKSVENTIIKHRNDQLEQKEKLSQKEQKEIQSIEKQNYDNLSKNQQTKKTDSFFKATQFKESSFHFDQNRLVDSEISEDLLLENKYLHNQKQLFKKYDELKAEMEKKADEEKNQKLEKERKVDQEKSQDTENQQCAEISLNAVINQNKQFYDQSEGNSTQVNDVLSHKQQQSNNQFKVKSHSNTQSNNSVDSEEFDDLSAYKSIQQIQPVMQQSINQRNELKSPQQTNEIKLFGQQPKSILKNKQQKQLEGKLTLLIDNYNLAFENINLIGKTVVECIQQLEAFKNNWIVPLFIIFKRMAQIRVEAYIKLEQKQNIFSFEDWAEIIESRQYAELLKKIQNENEMVKNELNQLLLRANDRASKLQKEKQDKILVYLNDDLSQELKDISFIYFYSQIYSHFIKSLTENPQNLEIKKLIIKIQCSMIISEQNVLDYPKEILDYEFVQRIFQTKDQNEIEKVSLQNESQLEIIKKRFKKKGYKI